MADPLDLLSLAEARKAINRTETNTDDDGVLARHVTAVSRMIDERCGPVVQRDITAELHDGGGCALYLRHWPVRSITLVRESQGGSIVTIPAVAFGATSAGYMAEPLPTNPTLLSGRLNRVSGWAYANEWAWGPMSVEVTYVAGRYADTAAVDARFKDCAGAVLRRLWKRETGIWQQASDIFDSLEGQPSAGFFKVAGPIINEMLGGEQQTTNLLGQA